MAENMDLTDGDDNTFKRERLPSRMISDDDYTSERLFHLKHVRAGFAGAITRKLREFNEMVCQGIDPGFIGHSLQCLNEAYDRFQTAHLEFASLAVDKEMFESSERHFIEVTERVQSARDAYDTMISQKQASDVQIAPDDSVSHVSHGSKASSVSSALARAAAKKAVLKTKAELLDQQIDLEKRQFEMGQKLKQLKLQADIEAASVEENILSQYVGTKPSGSAISQHTVNIKPPIAAFIKREVSPTSHQANVNVKHGVTDSTAPIRKVNKPALNPYAAEWTGGSKLIAGNSVVPPTQMDKANVHMQREIFQRPDPGLNIHQQLLDVWSLPKSSLMTFDGNPLDYWVFINSFESCVGQTAASDGVKLNRLLQYCSGKAAHVIKPCMVMNPSEGYAHARKLLKERFGNNYMISEAWVKRITEGGQIRPNDGQALQTFADDVNACMEVLKAMGMLEEIDSRCRMVKLVSRLPFYIQSRWRKEAYRSLQRVGKYPNMMAFVTFLNTIARELLDPVFGLVSDSSTKVLKSKPDPPKGRGASFNVQSSVQTNKNNKSSWSSNVRDKTKTLKCFMCSGNHQMSTCEKFLKLSPARRLEVTKEHRLCFNCLEFRNHSARLCRKPGTCDVANCKQKHSKLLHEAFHMSKENDQNSRVQAELNSIVDKGQKIEASSYACGKSVSESSKVSLPIVTIHVRGKNQKEFTKTNALLDPGSNKTFCSYEFARSLGIKGKHTILSLETLSDGKDSAVEEVSLEATSTVGKRKTRQVIELSKVYALRDFPSLKGSVASSLDIKEWDHLKDVSVPTEENVTILIGQDVPQALLPLDIRRGNDGEPYAVKTALGWTINGPLGEICDRLHVAAVSRFVNVKSVEDVNIEAQLERFWKIDTGQVLAGSMPQLSVDDKRVLHVWENSIERSEGHYQLNIPFKADSFGLPDNKTLALKRLQYLGKRLAKDHELCERYSCEISKLIERGYAERISDKEIDVDKGRIWYLPHHAVINPNKPDKLRVGFDCAAEYKGTSLNNNVSQGPDMTNGLLGVLLRFREGRVALMADIETMFYQVKVSPEHRNVLRFLWWKDGDISQEPITYRMTVHPFGGIWSPSCVNFVLNRTVEDNASSFDSETKSTVLKNFYVDDCLKSLDSVENAIKLVKELCRLTSLGGFRLTKWVSNSRVVMENIPLDERAKEMRELELDCGSLPVERALGVKWDIESDTFGIKVKEKITDFTRRSLLSITSSVYDPLGLVCPYVLQAKKIFQSECKRNKGWDEEMDGKNKELWLKWLQELPKLREFRIDRCIIPINFGPCVTVELHHFCDASQEAYGAVSYIRVVDNVGNIHCAFLLGKSRLAPIKQMSIPRLELSAAVVAVRISSLLNSELSFVVDKNVFWTDSMIVLQYIKNKTKRFHTFVANRVAVIHDGSSPESWRHVDTKVNPADDASRGLNVTQMISNKRWRQGPEFLWRNEDKWPNISCYPELSTDDQEVRAKAHVCVLKPKCTNNPTNLLLTHYSSWHRLKKAVAWMIKFKIWLKCKQKVAKGLNVEDLRHAEQSIIHYVQGQHFHEEVQALKCLKGTVSKKSPIYSLEPFLDNNGIIRTGGRLLSAPIPDSAKYPALLPREGHVTSLIVRHVHEFETKHSGREYVLAVVRQKFWIPRGRPLINEILRKCVLCKRLRAIAGSQKMASLPADRVLSGNAPFTFVGVDCFGPFYVKRGRSQEKRYGCLFTCLSIRAIHIERLHTLDTDSFISALIRFIARRGVPKLIRSDNGSNFVGGERELRASLMQYDGHTVTNEYLLMRDIKWEFNPPSASHMGGVWERQIRTVRKVLNVILKNQVLDDERLDTVFCEAEAIVNGRPITYVSDNPKDLEPLTPNHLLLLRSNQMVPIGIFKTQDRYKRRWKHAQFLADQFWKRWLVEYLPTLQARKRWTAVKDNFKEGDIVLVMCESTSRMSWPLGRVIEVYPGKDGLVRSVKVKTMSAVLVRPIHKLCHLETASAK